MGIYRVWVCGLVALLWSVGGAANARDLTVVSFGGSLQDAIRSAFIEPFTASTGIKIAEDSHDGALSKISTQIDTCAIKWDVVDVESKSVAARMRRGGFRESRFSNRRDGPHLRQAEAG